MNESCTHSPLSFKILPLRREFILVGIAEVGWSSISYRDRSCPILACRGKLFSKNVMSHDSNSVTMSLSCSPINTYPFDCSEYLMKIHFLPLGPNFSYL